MFEDSENYYCQEQTEDRSHLKHPRRRISIRDDVYMELKRQAKREKYLTNELAEKIFEDFLAKCKQACFISII